MIIKEYNEYKKYRYFSDEKFMKYFNSINEKVKELFPDYTLNLELVIENISYLYHEGYYVDDAINWLYYNGNIFEFRVTNGDS